MAVPGVVDFMDEDGTALPEEQASRYRSISALLNCLAQGRVDLVFSENKALSGHVHSDEYILEEGGAGRQVCQDEHTDSDEIQLPRADGDHGCVQ